MPPEIIQIVVPLTFLGILGVAGEILVHCRRGKLAEQRVPLPVLRNVEPRPDGEAAKRGDTYR